MNNKIELNEVRDFSGRINITFSFIKQNGKIIAKNLAYLIPVFLLIGIIVGATLGTAYSNISEFYLYNIDDFIGMYGSILVASILVSIISLISILFVTGYVVEYEKSEDGNVDTAFVWKQIKKSFLGTLVASFLAGIAGVIGLLLCLLPGIWILVTFSLFIPAYVYGKSHNNGISAFGSLSESSGLVKQDFFGTFGYLFVIVIIVMAFSFALSIPTTIVQSMTMLLHENQTVLTVLYAVSYAVSYIGNLFFSAILYIALVFMFFDLKERRDGTSMSRKIESIGQESNF